MGEDGARVGSRVAGEARKLKSVGRRRDGGLRSVVGHVLLGEVDQSGLVSSGALVVGLERRRWERSGRVDGRSGGLREPGTSEDGIPQLRDSDPGVGVGVEYSPQDGIKLVGDGQDGAEKVGVLHEGAEGRVLKRGLFPWVAAAGEVDQNDAQGPDVVGGRLVGSVGLGVWLLAFCGAVSHGSRIQGKTEHTWRHVKGRTTSKIRRQRVRGGQTKVGQLNGVAVVRDQDVLRLEVPVVDSKGVAVAHGIQDLEKGAARKLFITSVSSPLGDVGKKVAVRAVFQNHVGAILGVHDFYQGNNVGMTAGPVVELNFALLEFPLAGLEVELVQGLDGILDSSVDVDGLVDGSIGTLAEDTSELEAWRLVGPRVGSNAAIESRRCRGSR